MLFIYFMSFIYLQGTKNGIFEQSLLDNTIIIIADLELKNSILRILLRICVTCVHFKNTGAFPNESPWFCGHGEPNSVHLSALEAEIYMKR